jgi:type II secretory pathway pseudopilin PulG
LQRHRRTICQQRGTTMIEIMVAALVLSAGLLGLAAMQTKALKTASGLATQQAMVQALGAFGEARLASPNENIVGGSGPSGEDYEYLARYCNGLSSGVTVNAVNGQDGSGINYGDPNYNENQIQQSIREGLGFIRTFLAKHTSCQSAALTEYADYWNEYGTYGETSTTNGVECNYIVPRTRTVSCKLPTGDKISLQNLVWTR